MFILDLSMLQQGLNDKPKMWIKTHKENVIIKAVLSKFVSSVSYYYQS
jgi:hypothetical protein